MNKSLPTIKNNKGFTLIELVVVIAVLAILFAITLIAINPARQFSNSRDTQRRSDINAILNALTQYLAEPGATMPSSVPTLPTTALIADDDGSAPAEADICSLLVTAYIAAMPVDPTTGDYTDCNDYNTGYTIGRSAANNRITVSATAEGTDPITVTR